MEESWGVGVGGTRVEAGGADVGGRPAGADPVDGDGAGANSVESADSVVGDGGNERDGRSDGGPAAGCPDVPPDAAGDPLVAPTRSADFCAAVGPPSERSGGPANRADPDSDNRPGRLVPAAAGSGIVPLADRGSAEPASSAPMLPAALLCAARPAAPAADGSGSPDNRRSDAWRSDTSGLCAAVAAAEGAGTADAGGGGALAAILIRAVSKSACSRS